MEWTFSKLNGYLYYYFYPVAYTKNAILTIVSAIPLLLFIISELHAWIYAIIKLLK